MVTIIIIFECHEFVRNITIINWWTVWYSGHYPRFQFNHKNLREQYSSSKTVFQKASNENRSPVLVSVLCNIEVARYMFTLKRIDLAISKSQTCNRHCLLNESISIYMCMQIFKRIIPPNWVSQTCKVPQRSTTTTHDWEVFNDKKKPQRPSPMICVHTCS